MNLPDKDGNVKKDALEQVRKQTGEDLEELTPPLEFPSKLSYLWSAFCTLSERRPSGMNGMLPISYEQLYAWKALTDQVLKPKDIEAILLLDRIFMKVYYGRR